MSICILTTLRSPAAEPAFFAMATAISGPPAQVAQTLKDLGYDGIGGGPYSAELVKEVEARGMKFFNAYLTLQFSSEEAALTPGLREIIDGLKGHDSALWIALQSVRKMGKGLPRASEDGDAVAVEKFKELAEYAAPRGVRIALYPHTGMYLERCADALRLCEKINLPTVGATFNLCHFLKVEGDIDPQTILKSALPRLFFVTINGADRGDTQKLNWDALIQTLDHGSYDAAAFVKNLRALGYAGPIGFQGYGIKGDSHDNLARTMAAWKKFPAH